MMRKALHRLLPISLTALAISTSACASLAGREPLISDRPDYTESPSVIAQGHVQLEVGTTVTEYGPVRTVSVGEILARIGVLPRAELRLAANPYARLQVSRQLSINGAEDVAVGAKIALLDAPDSLSWQPQLALLLDVSLPTGARLYRAPGAQPSAALAAAWQLTPVVSLSSNVGYASVFDGSTDGISRIGEATATASLGFAVTPRVGLFTEVYAIRLQSEYSSARKYFDTGATVLLSPDLQLDARVGIGPSLDSGDFFFGVGLVKRW